MITVRQATVIDIPGIMRFIDENWRKSDTLAINRSFFEWSFVRENLVTMILGIEEETGDIYGIFGYIPYTSDPYPDCYTTIWKVKKGAPLFLGQDMVDYFYLKIQKRYVTSAGLREKAVKLAKLRGMTITRMDHFYRLNCLSEYHIASVVDNTIPETPRTGDSISQIRDIGRLKEVLPENVLKSAILKKNYKYIEHRYFDHPVYDYELWQISNDKDDDNAVVITREEKYKDYKSLKIVDFYGDESKIVSFGSLFDEIMRERGYEFVDIYSYGISTDLYLKSGFLGCNSDSENIIPNYFHPFEKRNVDIILKRPDYEGLKLFRGDGDQDRPCE